jgi:hypothetical protein
VIIVIPEVIEPGAFDCRMGERIEGGEFIMGSGRDEDKSDVKFLYTLFVVDFNSKNLDGIYEALKNGKF